MAGHKMLFHYAMTRPGEMAMRGTVRTVRSRTGIPAASLATALLAVAIVV